MSSFVLKRVVLSIIFSLGITFLFIFIMFESLGITEYVWPILFPILAWTLGLISLILIIVGIACRAGGGIPSDQTMVQRKFLQPTYPTYESPTIGSVYVVPVYCPHCSDKLELDRVEWIGATDFTCPSCQRVVQAGVRENL